MKEQGMNEMPLMQENEGIVLFYPNVPESAVADNKVVSENDK